ncbi:MAG: recombinase family protein [Lachnospirales bacterium]
MITALYLRLSKDDEDLDKNLKSTSNSIINQKMLLESFVESKEDLKDSEVITLIDDGYSGTTFDRPNIKKLLDMVSNKEIDCIIVKDFSRFGRNYIEVSDYLDQIFPFLGIRFISVSDNYDSDTLKGKTSGIDVAFKNIIYNYYSKDLSKKIRSSKNTKALKGEYLSPYAPFGYAKNVNNKNKLVIEEHSAKVVVDVFEMAYKGKKTVEIARILNDKNVPPRSAFKNKNGVSHSWQNTNGKVIWNSSNVASILRDERYLGKTIYNKKVRPKLGVNRVVSVPKEDWVVVDNTHVPLVSETVFYKAQEVMRTFKSTKDLKKEVHLFSKKLKCGECGYSLARAKKKDVKYYCEVRYNDINSNCTTELVNEDVIAKTILETIKVYATLFLEKEIVENKVRKVSATTEIEVELKKYKNNLLKYETKKGDLYEDYLNGKVSKDKYIEMCNDLKEKKSWVESKIIELELSLNEMREKERLLSENKPNEQKLIDSLGFDVLTRNMVEYFVDCIYIYSGDRFLVVWNFEDLNNHA